MTSVGPSFDYFDLYCVGCGQYAARTQLWQAGGLGKPLELRWETNIHCPRCGATQALFYEPKTGCYLIPTVLQRTQHGIFKHPFHLEHFLGYSEHESGIKHGLVIVLMALGLTSQEDCLEPKCQKFYRVEKNRKRSVLKMEVGL